MSLTNESKIERNSILKFFTTDLGGLGYEERTIHQASKDLFIKSDVMKQLKSTVNIHNFKKVLKKHFNGNEDDFYEAYKEAIKDKLNKEKIFNVAILLNEPLYFKGVEFVLFNKKNKLSKRNCSFKNNTFAVISQYTHKLTGINNVLLKESFSPDLIFFVNGIYFSYQELKFLTNKQNAKEHGINQILEKYFNSYNTYEKQLESAVASNALYSQTETKGNKKAKTTAFRKNMLRIFSAPIFITAFDCQEMYVVRKFSEIEMQLKNIKPSERYYQQASFFNKARKEFSPYPVDSWQKCLAALYSKESIEREILYYNMTEKEQRLIKDKKGKKVLKDKDEVGILISPRPKQKYGVDKVISIIEDKLNNNLNPEEELELLKSQIKELPEKVKKEILEDHLKYKNNKFIDSIILSYAAGFGKTNIIGWLSLLIKDITIEKDNYVKYAYDTIFLITDRIELKEQINQKMRQMNVEKGLVEEVKNTSDFKKIMSKKPKIVIVNIQKFTNIKKIFTDEESSEFKKRKNVFIIDEIHRSNNGDQHDDMMSLFTDMVDNDSNYENRNLLIGLTATPSDETLLRFGKYAGYGKNGAIIYKAHDSYSMKESIKDGFTLPFENRMSTVSISMEAYEKHRNVGRGDEEKFKNSKDDIYENEGRCKYISEDIVKKLLGNVYKQILVGRGGKHQGKAMLACYSIATAIMHFNFIKKELERVCNEVINNPESSKQEIELYKYYKDTGVYIVYSDPVDKRYPKSSKLNNGDDEKTVINNFKNNRNGLMIVVDKLQTGFDEKKIHTLFLNTEKKGIGLIQLCSRANRTLKGKLDCHIIDYSHDNVNYTENLPAAWAKYSGEAYSTTDLVSPMEQIKQQYKTLKKEGLYYVPLNKEFVKNLKDFENENAASTVLEIEKEITNIYRNNNQYSKNLEDLIYSYFRNLKLVDFVLEIEPKYKNEDFILFYKKLLNHFSRLKDEFDGTVIEIGWIFDEGGETIEETVINTTEVGTGTGDSSSTDSEVNLIELFNEHEISKIEKIENFKRWQKMIIDFIIEKSNEEPGSKNDLISKINNMESNEILIETLEVLIRKCGRNPSLKEIPKEVLEILKINGIQYFLEVIKKYIK